MQNSTKPMRARKKSLAVIRIERLREEFKTCEYRNSGAYNDVPTIVGGLERLELEGRAMPLLCLPSLLYNADDQPQ